MNNLKHLLIFSNHYSLVLFTNCGKASEDVVVDAGSDFIYLDENCITIKAIENAVGVKNYKLNGVTDLIIDKDLLAQMIAEEKDIRKVITSSITDMVGMFYRTSFNQDISSWDVSNVKNMANMFCEASSFNQNISNWDVSNVGIMALMFKNASTFNQDLSSWAVINVTDCRQFSYEITTWALPRPNFTNCTE